MAFRVRLRVSERCNDNLAQQLGNTNFVRRVGVRYISRDSRHTARTVTEDDLRERFNDVFKDRIIGALEFEIV